MKTDDKKLQKVTLTMQEIWQQTKPVVYRNKKKYNRKDKPNKKDIQSQED